MTPRVRTLLLDDDRYALEFLKAMLEDRFPELEIELRERPDPSGDYDLYFLDDDFDGIRLAAKLAQRIRKEQPDAIILAFSASLDAETLRLLIEAGCNGVCDKKVPGDMPEMLSALERGLDELRRRRQNLMDDDGRPRIVPTFRALFAEWNRRLDDQEVA